MDKIPTTKMVNEGSQAVEEPFHATAVKSPTSRTATDLPSRLGTMMAQNEGVTAADASDCRKAYFLGRSQSKN